MDTRRRYTFKTPLARAILDDPAFSSDPRSHPHFPLTNARSYKALPPKSIPSPPTKTLSKPPPIPMPEILPKPHNTVLKPVRTNIPRKARMKAFVRRLTTRNEILDRIDELDETDPFGGSYHHDGPYEAIGSNLVQPALPRRGNIHRSRRESDPHPSRSGQHHSAPWVPSVEAGLSLHLKPGQILQQNTIYTSHLSNITALSASSHPQPNKVSAPSRPQSLPNPRKYHHEDHSSLDPRDGFQTRQPTSLHTPREPYLGDYTPDIFNDAPFHPVKGAAPHVLHETEKIIIPPPRYDSRLRSSGLPPLPQRTPPPPSNPTSPKVHSTEDVEPALHSRRKTAHSLDSSHTISSAFTQSSASVQDKPLDHPRIRHLPKRLVMPAPLQPRPPQPQYNLPPAGPPVWQDACPDDYALEDAQFERKLAMYGQEPRLLRKKSSAYPAKIPIPNHVVMSQDDAVSRKANSLAKTANDAESTKERLRRRRLSKRKNDT
ncbi:hypothetical protein JVT61DRAFT_5413 [Boletus reticuloceps]|uniref:Uncharacterized protein n=1 Tax=Boletus reticuloceps TaxID=495285 RepID=A0A8I3AF26_9AGAM|nr:hypothetical protein JVT61DRAFT_5413 [Boletus reticuloceps]